MRITMGRSTRAVGAFLLLGVVLLLVGSGSLARGAAPIYGAASHRTVGALPADAGDWPMYGHDVSRTSYNPAETVIGPGNLSQVAPRWQANVGMSTYPSSSSPSIANGKVYVGSSASSGPNFFSFD